jgi:hypothetical protein
VAPAQPSPAAVEKCTKRRGVDGTSIMAWHDLIGELGTLTINEVALPLGEAAGPVVMLLDLGAAQHPRARGRACRYGRSAI